MADSLDDYEFAPTPSSNLASLFGSAAAPINDAPSLIYSAPRQPQPKPAGIIDPSSTNEPESKSSVINAIVVTVWKLASDKYTPIGKHGLAIIGYPSKNSYEIILYKDKRNIIARSKLNNNFEIVLKKNHFATFSDNDLQNWLLKFSDSTDCDGFIKYVVSFGGRTTEDIEKNDQKAINTSTSRQTDETDSVEVKRKSKPDILTRIARMGQSILPNTSQSTDSSDEEIKNPKTPPLPSQTALNISQSFSTNFSEQSDSQVSTNLTPSPRPQNMRYDPINLYFAESRAQNTEVRFNLSQISDKLNHILQAVDTSGSGDTHSILTSKVKVLELKVENLSKELKQYQDKSCKLEQQLSFRKENSGHAESCQKEIEVLNEQHEIKLREYKDEELLLQNKVAELSEIINSRNCELKDYCDRLEFSRNIHSDVEIELHATISRLEQQIADFESKEEIGDDKIRLEANRSKFVTILKDLMNGMYTNIVANFQESETYSSSQIQNVVAKNIKTETRKIIQNFEDLM